MNNGDIVVVLTVAGLEVIGRVCLPEQAVFNTDAEFTLEKPRRIAGQPMQTAQGVTMQIGLAPLALIHRDKDITLTPSNCMMIEGAPSDLESIYIEDTTSIHLG